MSRTVQARPPWGGFATMPARSFVLGDRPRESGRGSGLAPRCRGYPGSAGDPFASVLGFTGRAARLMCSCGFVLSPNEAFEHTFWYSNEMALYCAQSACDARIVAHQSGKSPDERKEMREETGLFWSLEGIKEIARIRHTYKAGKAPSVFAEMNRADTYQALTDVPEVPGI